MIALATKVRLSCDVIGCGERIDGELLLTAGGSWVCRSPGKWQVIAVGAFEPLSARCPEHHHEKSGIITPGSIQ